MILSDQSIEKAIDQWDMISPYSYDRLQPASYDLQLLEIVGAIQIGTDQWVIQPKQFVLGSTIEKISLPEHIVGRIEGKSSWARKGLWIHAAGFIDPGFHGQITLELVNQNDECIQLSKGQLIAQISFQIMDWPAKRPYGTPELGSHYQGQVGTTPSVIRQANQGSQRETKNESS